MTHREWFKETVGDDSVNVAAKKAGVQQSTLNRQLTRGTIPAESVIMIARVYTGNPIQALVDTGYITTQEAQESLTIIDWHTASEADLTRELLRRVDTTGIINQPLDGDGVRRVVDESSD